MRRRAKVDANHSDIVRALREVGCSVQSLAEIGDGCPDLLVAFELGGRPETICLELKDGSKVPSKQRLTEDESNWHAKWRGRVETVTSVDEALAAIKRG